MAQEEIKQEDGKKVWILQVPPAPFRIQGVKKKKKEAKLQHYF